ncbi:hypothetical protein EWM64_g694 [Hericium alpestre]|uniref:Natural resistance-associated macrophage protein n=1 Tax=Hericium alpestre TaxID=135208 RepID=A0A4Z0A898_9AGAM|nr:hypothetical protein EWM64_g694 [Hericium alpestre]
MPSPLASQTAEPSLPPPEADIDNGTRPRPAIPITGKSTRLVRKIVHHVRRHAGAGIVCAVAYFDPGNWSVDMQAGSIFGYRPMLFVILMAGLDYGLQAWLCDRLSLARRADLATQCRLLLQSSPKHRKLMRYTLLYPLYALCEIAIISTDLAELLGSAIGLCLIFPKLPLWVAVLLTAGDVLVFLIIGDPTRSKGNSARVFELTIIALVHDAQVSGVFISFIILLVKVGADWPQVFLGFIPDKTLVQVKPNAVYTAVGILGATVMPHALFLGSFLSTQDRLSTDLPSLPAPTHGARLGIRRRIQAWVRSLFTMSRSERVATDREHRNKYTRPENNTLDFIHAHLGHSTFDIVASLLCVAVPINAAILVIAATVFFQQTGDAESMVPAGLFEAHDLIREHIGKAAAFIFALALLCAGQTASITATLAGQIVSEGFIEWRISPFLRRLITRLLGLLPSIAVAIAVGRNGVDTLLVASQVALSIVLPFVVFPLVWITSSSAIMSVRRPLHPEPFASEHHGGDPAEELQPEASPDDMVAVDAQKAEVAREDRMLADTMSLSRDAEKAEVTQQEGILADAASFSEGGIIDYSNGRIMRYLGYAIWFIVVLANAYVLVELALGRTNIT